MRFQDGKWNIEEEDEGEEDDEEGEEEDDDEEGEEEAEEEEGEEDNGEEGEEEEGGSSEEEDGHSDLESDNESEDEERESEAKEKSAKPLSQEEKNAQQEAAKSELPYTFAGTCTHKLSKSIHICAIYHLCPLFFPVAPESFSELKDLLCSHTPDNQRLILARTLKCNHPSLAVGNKLKLQVN